MCTYHIVLAAPPAAGRQGVQNDIGGVGNERHQHGRQQPIEGRLAQWAQAAFVGIARVRQTSGEAGGKVLPRATAARRRRRGYGRAGADSVDGRRRGLGPLGGGNAPGGERHDEEDEQHERIDIARHDEQVLIVRGRGRRHGRVWLARAHAERCRLSTGGGGGEGWRAGTWSLVGRGAAVSRGGRAGGMVAGSERGRGGEGRRGGEQQEEEHTRRAQMNDDGGFAAARATRGPLVRQPRPRQACPGASVHRPAPRIPGATSRRDQRQQQRQIGAADARRRSCGYVCPCTRHPRRAGGAAARWRGRLAACTRALLVRVIDDLTR